MIRPMNQNLNQNQTLNPCRWDKLALLLRRDNGGLMTEPAFIVKREDISLLTARLREGKLTLPKNG